MKQNHRGPEARVTHPLSPYMQGLIEGITSTEGAMRVDGQDHSAGEDPREVNETPQEYSDFVKGLFEGSSIRCVLARAGLQVVPTANEAQTAPAKPTMDLKAMSSEQLIHAYGGSE